MRSLGRIVLAEIDCRADCENLKRSSISYGNTLYFKTFSNEFSSLAVSTSFTYPETPDRSSDSDR